MARPASFLLALGLLGCSNPWGTWVPAHPAGVVQCAPHGLGKPTIYILRGEELPQLMLRLETPEGWVLNEATEPGYFSRQLSAGAVSGAGMLGGTPADLFKGATSVWSVSGDCRVGGENVPKKS